MQRQATIGIMVLALGVAGCADQAPTSLPGASATSDASPVPDVSLTNVPTRRSSALSLVQQARRAGLKLHPSGFGKRSYAAWKAMEGRQDSKGDGDHALYFQKMVPTPVFAAGVAIVERVQGLPASAITGLSWEHRSDGHCGAGAPRWNLGLNSSSGQRYTVFLGCAAAAHTPAGTDDQGRVWIRDSYPGVGAGSIAQQIQEQTGLSPGMLTVRSLVIVFDEGNDLGFPGYVHLDNITVAVNGTPQVFTGPMDNSNSR